MREQYWIDFYDSANPNIGYNICPIANSRLHCPAPPRTEEWKKKHSEQMSGKGNPMYGSHRTGKANPNAKPVEQYALDGTFIARYDTAVKAMKATGANKSSIRDSCKSEYRTAGGFQWKYEGSDKEIKPIQVKDKVTPKENIIGKKFNRLTVLKQIEDYIYPNGKHAARYLCKCDCGNLKEICKGSLVGGNIKSCGCYGREQIIKSNKIKKKKYNKYDLTKDYGIGFDCHGKEFYFDLEDYDKIKNHSWHFNPDGSVVSFVGDKNILMHRYVTNTCYGQNVYHKNKNKFDNRKANLSIGKKKER